MYLIVDKCMLFLYCMLSLQFFPVTSSFVLACLAAVSVSALLAALPGKSFSPWVLTGYGLVFFFLPECGFFLPLILYDVLPFPEWGRPPESEASGLPRTLAQTLPAPVLALGLASHLILGHLPRTPALLFTAAGCLFSLLLRRRTSSCLSLIQKYRRIRDDDTELQLLLKERNQSLLEKQDSEIYAATLRERNRIAREIHDNVGHLLTRSILMVGALRAVYRDPALSEPLNQLGDTLNQAMDSIRQSVHDLHDSTVNLQETLQTLIRDFTFCPVSLRCEIEPDVPRTVKYSLISIAKEALVNISRHSNATEASITAVEHPGFYQFIVEDNGTLPPGAPQGDGIGLYNMKSRVDALNGTMRIQTEGGFRIHITIPRQKEPRRFSDSE